MPPGELSLAALVSVQLLVVPASNPYRGRLRDRPAVVRLNGKVHNELPDVTEVRILVDRALQSLSAAIDGGAARSDPVGVASEVAFRLMEAHPFVDGNGRVARAVANWILERAGYRGTRDTQVFCRARQVEYYEALAARQGAAGRGVDSDRWRGFFEDLVADCYEAPAV